MQKYKLNGRLVEVGEVQTGTSRTGNEWRRMNFVVETESENGYKDKYCFRAFGPTVDLVGQIKLNDGCEVTFSVSCRQWQDKWFTDLMAEDVKSDFPY